VTLIEPTAEERVVARRAAESRATIPTLELSVELPAPPSTGRLLSACAQALRQHPRANGAYRDGRFELYSRVNLGLVVAEGGRYLIPTLFDADQSSAAELEQRAERLSAEALAGRLAAPSFAGATFTVWNAGRLGLAGAALPVVPPQAGVLVAGLRTLTLACDHRILYGEAAAAFLTAVTAGL